MSIHTYSLSKCKYFIISFILLYSLLSLHTDNYNTIIFSLFPVSGFPAWASILITSLVSIIYTSLVGILHSVLCKASPCDYYNIQIKSIFQWNCLPKALDDSETVDILTHGLMELNSPPLWHWPHQPLYSKRSFCWLCIQIIQIQIRLLDRIRTSSKV